jgi:predicted  nucleic acid-binding Zn-ribbon protein
VERNEPIVTADIVARIKAQAGAAGADPALKVAGDINTPDGSGRAPIHLAVTVDMIKLLASHGGDINCRTTAGDTPLILAAQAGLLPVVEWLLTNPTVDVQARNSAGASALDAAASHPSCHVVIDAHILRCRVAELEKTVAAQQADLTQCKADGAGLTAELAALKTELAKVKEALASSNKKLGRSDTELKTVKKELETVKAQVVSLNTDLASAQAQVASTKAELEAVQAGRAEESLVAAQRSEDLSRQIVELQQTLSRMQSEAEQASLERKQAEAAQAHVLQQHDEVKVRPVSLFELGFVGADHIL